VRRLIDAKREFVLKPKYAQMMSFNRPGNEQDPDDVLYSEGMMPIISECRWGFADTSTAKIAIKPNYAEVGCFRNGLAKVGIRHYNFCIVPKVE
jgi:hypothetical protein